MVSNFRITTKMPRTSDEYGMLLSNLLEQNSISHDDIEDAIIASVVPNVMHSLEGAIIKYFSIRPIIVEPGTKTGIRVVTENPRQIGADPVLWMQRQRMSCMADRCLSLILARQPRTIWWTRTARLYPALQLQESAFPQKHCGKMRRSFRRLRSASRRASSQKETISSMQAGLVYGQIGQTEYIIRHMIDEANMGEVKVVATGGLGRIIANETTMIDVYDPNLTLKGMNLIYKKQNRKSGKIK